MCAQLCLTLCYPMNCSPLDFFVHRILQARVLEWVAIFSSSGHRITLAIKATSNDVACQIVILNFFIPRHSPHLHFCYPLQKRKKKNEMKLKNNYNTQYILPKYPDDIQFIIWLKYLLQKCLWQKCL